MMLQSQVKWLKHRILIFTILGIVITASIAGISVAFPFYSFVKADNDKTLIQAAKNRAMLIETYLSGLHNIASLVTTRTYARQQMEKYLKGVMGQQELEYSISPILGDAMQLLPELIAIIRHDPQGQPLVHVGTPFRGATWTIPSNNIDQPQVNGPVMLDKKYYIYVTAPVFNRKNENLGTDVLVFQLTEIQKIIQDPNALGTTGSVSLGWLDDVSLHLFFNPKGRKTHTQPDDSYSPLSKALKQAIDGKTGILIGSTSANNSYMTAYSPVARSNWGLAVTMSTSELYSSVKRQMLFTGGMMLLLILIGTVATFNMIRSLSGKILLHSDELEHQIDEKTSELQRANRSLQALNAVNEVLVRASSESDLLEEICRIIVDIAGFNLAWIGLREGKDKQYVQAAKQYCCDASCLDMSQLLNDNLAWLKSPGGVALQTGKPSVCTDISTSNCFSQYWQKTCSIDCDAVAGFPLIVGESTLGVLLVYASAADAFEDEQLSLMQRLADNLAFGLIALRDKSGRQKLQRQLLQAQKMEAIGQLTGGIAHDFNNILASILGYTELLQAISQTELNNPKAHEYLSRIEQSGMRARDLVAQMLAFSRGGSSESQPLLLEPMVKDALKMLHSTLPSSIELYTHIEDQLTTVMMDPVQFHQLMMNLCINARDAMSGVGTIDITIRRVEIHNKECASCYRSLNGEFEELIVKDSGNGVSTDALERIFEPFFTTKDVGKGTGMGLSMVHGIMHEHGGHILVDSVAGRGTSFHLLFPIISASNNSDHTELKDSIAIDNPDNSTVKHILVVDDDEMVAEFEKELLTKRGYQVTIKHNSQEALELFSNNSKQFDLVLTDQTMPGMTGVEMSQKILALAPKTPIILCTGFSEYVDEKSAKKMGIHAFLNKPIDIQKLLDAINKIQK